MNTIEAAPRPRPPLVLGLRFLRILWRLLVPIAIAATLLAWTYLLDASDSLKEQALVSSVILLLAALIAAVVQEVLSPRNDELRLLPMTSARAERLMAIVRTLLVLFLGIELALYFVRVNEWSESITALLSLLRVLGLIFFGWSAISRSGLLEKITPEEPKSVWALALRVLIKLVLPLGVFTLLFYTVANALGYEALAHWVLKKAGWTAVMALSTVILYRFLKLRLHHTMSFMRNEQVTEEGGVAPFWIGLDRILSGLLKLVMAALVYFTLLAIWNLDTGQLSGWLASPLFFEGGQTFGGLLGELARFAMVYVLYGFTRNLLIFFVFPKAQVEAGARYAMLTVLKYAAFVLGALFLLAAFGADTSMLAVFAGGASVGLAFGMKDIFSNFFSGLIMLLERPVRVGDTIEVDGNKGKVEAIRLRGTTIRTFDGTMVIVPNTQMIGTSLANLSHTLETARMQIDVGVSYNESPAEVEEVLLKVARADPRVLRDPAPVVRFNNFGDSSLDFTLRVWTHDIGDRWAMVSEMRVEIFEAFKVADIEIPFPQTDLHVRSDATRESAAP